MRNRTWGLIRQIYKYSTWNVWLHITAVGMFLMSSLLLARFIYIYPISPAFDWAQASGSFLYIIIVASFGFFTYMTITWSFSLAPLWLTSVMIDPFLYLRIWKVRQVTAGIGASKNTPNGSC